MDAQQHLSLRDYGRVITKRWKVVAIFTLLGLAMGVLMYLTSAKAYKATSEVLIERPSGYVISATVSALGTATSTKQQQHFLDTDNYQKLARALVNIAPRIHLDMRDSATLDDISTVIQTDILNSEFVTPVRIALYDLPSPSLLSFQQAKTIKDAPALGESLKAFARMAMPGDFSLTQGWLRGRPGPSDRAVRDNLRSLAHSPMLHSLESLGITDAAASDLTSAADDETSPDLDTYAKVALAARTIAILSDLDTASGTAEERGSNINQSKSGPEVLKDAAKIMSSHFVATLELGPGDLSNKWGSLSPDGKLDAIQQAADALSAWHGKHQSKSDLVWDVNGKEVVDGTDIIAITQTAPTADQARLAANAMAAVMVWQDRMTKVADAERSVRFLTTQLGDDSTGATRDLRIKEDELTAYRKANRLVDAETQLKAAAEEAASLDSDKGKARAAISEAQASLRKVLQQLGVSREFVQAPTIKQNPLIDSIKADLIKTETDLAGLRAQGFTDEWPALMSSKAQLENLQHRLDDEFKRRDSIERQYTPDPVHFALAGRAAELAATIVGLQARQIALNNLLSEMDLRFSTLPDKQADLLRRMRAEALAERQYTDLYARLIDAKNNRAMRQGNARVVSVALEPGEKVAPRNRTIIIAFLLGAFVGCSCALALSAVDTHLRTVEDVQRELKLPVLAHLPAIPSGNTLIVESSPASEITEAFRGLRSTIRFSGGDTPPKSIAATAVRAGEAKSAVVANLAASLAQAGLTITAVDADLRRPRLAGFFGSNATTGLAEVLSTGKPARDARQATRIPGLYVIPAGAAVSGAGELLENGRIGAALANLAEVNDLVLVDTAPIGAVSDAAVVGSAADATILVVEAGSVSPEEARNAVAKLTSAARAKLIGVVLVGGDAPISADFRHYAAGEGSDNPPSKKRRKSQA